MFRRSNLIYHFIFYSLKELYRYKYFIINNFIINLQLLVLENAKIEYSLQLCNLRVTYLDTK